MQADRALRRVVIDLAILPELEQMAILDMLEPAQRRRVSALLLEYAGAPQEMEKSSSVRIDTAGLSPWLADRVRSGDAMTTQACALLRQCASELLPVVSGSTPSRTGVLGRLGATVRGGRMIR